MSSPTQSSPPAAARATRSTDAPASAFLSAHRSTASVGGDPNVMAGSIRAGSTPSLSFVHAIRSVAMEPPRECPAKHRRAVAGAEAARGAISGQNASVISETPAWHTTGTAGCNGAGHIFAMFALSWRLSTASSFHAAPRTMNQRWVTTPPPRSDSESESESASASSSRADADAPEGDDERAGAADESPAGVAASARFASPAGSILSHTNQRVHGVTPCARRTNPSRETHGSRSPAL